MANCKDIIFAFLLACSLLGTAFAQQRSPWHETWHITKHNDISINNINMEIDSVEFYEKLIQKYNKDASYSQNVAGIIIGAPLSFIGSIFLSQDYIKQIHQAG